MIDPNIAEITPGRRDLEYTHHDFMMIRDMLYDHSGIDLHEGKETMVYSRLSRRIKELHFTSFKKYCDYRAPRTLFVLWQTEVLYKR